MSQPPPWEAWACSRPAQPHAWRPAAPPDTHVRPPACRSESCTAAHAGISGDRHTEKFSHPVYTLPRMRGRVSDKQRHIAPRLHVQNTVQSQAAVNGEACQCNYDKFCRHLVAQQEACNGPLRTVLFSSSMPSFPSQSRTLQNTTALGSQDLAQQFARQQGANVSDLRQTRRSPLACSTGAITRPRCCSARMTCC